MNWPFYKKGKEEIIWVDGTPLNKLVKMPIVPIKYSRNLLKTHWSDVYVGEHVNSFIDNMNVLYVALTRPKQALYVFAEQKLKNDLERVEFHCLREFNRAIFGDHIYGKIIDHSYLNKIEGLENPSSENLCKWIWQRLIKTLPSLKRIEIKETDSTGCIYQGK